MSNLISNYSIDHPSLHENALQALAAADIALAHAPSLAIKEPCALADVTGQWLNEIVGSATPGAEIAEIIIGDTHDGMTSRQKLNLRWNSAGQQAGLPQSLFVKATPENPFLRETLAMLHMHEIEARFYQTLQPELGSMAPKSYYARSYPGGRFLILLEDLSVRGCRPYWLADTCDLAHAKAVIVALGRMHAKYWQSDRLLNDLVWVRPRTKRFGWTWLEQAFQYARSALPGKIAENEFPEEMASLLRLWNQHANAIFNAWEKQPRTVLHGDPHLGNTFSSPDGTAGLFDWQVKFSGHGLRDIAYFILSALSNEDRKKNERDLFDLYLETLVEGNVRLDRQEAWNDYCLFALDGWDANIMTIVQGGYGHAPAAQMRGFQCAIGCMMDNDVKGRLEHFIRHQLK